MDFNVHPTSDSTPPTRNTILSSFLRGRVRSHDLTPPHQHVQSVSPTDYYALDMHHGLLGPSAAGATLRPQSGNNGHNLMARRSTGGVPSAPSPSSGNRVASNRSSRHMVPPLNIPTTSTNSPPAPGAHRLRLVPHLDSRRSLKFDAVTRDLVVGDAPLRVGRFTDRSNIAGDTNANVSVAGHNKLAFKSKVVSRAHAEIWVESTSSGVTFFVKDTKSSSGTFVNNARLSAANTESQKVPIKDGDIVQLGVDYQGGHEDIYKSVKMRIELGREWQTRKNKFNTNALKNIKTLASTPTNGKAAAGPMASNIPDCCICLFGVTVRQALFIAPCSHIFHYKCLRPLLEQHHPGFMCPVCRSFADLEEDVEVEAEESVEQDDDEEMEAAIQASAKDIPALVSPNETDGTPIRGEDPERERPRPGEETEVEGEGSSARVRGSRRNRTARRSVNLSQMHERSEDEDIDMHSASRRVSRAGLSGTSGGSPDADRDEDIAMISSDPEDVGHVVRRVAKDN